MFEVVLKSNVFFLNDMIWALHGAVGRSTDWLDFAAALKRVPERSSSSSSPEAAEVRRLDLWRFLDCCPMSLEAAGVAIAGQIARIDPDPILVGYSMGGRLALHALLADPQMWRAAVIVSAHPGLTSEPERVVRRKSDAEWSALALKGEWSNFLRKWDEQAVLGGGVQMADRMELKQRRVSIARSFVDWSLGAQQDLAPSFKEMKCPVLWVTGERDAKFTTLAQQAVAHFPQGEHQMISDCGHRVPWEEADKFAKCCGEFFAELP